MGKSEERQFWLTSNVLGDRVRLPLTADEFQELKAAWLAVVEGLGLEERLGLVLDNYVEYEATLLRGALDSLIYAGVSWSEFASRTHTVNRRLVNLLSSCRSYIDQLQHAARSLFEQSAEERNQIKEWLSEQYDGLLGYRVLEALRNHAQHRGMAVHHLAVHFWWVKPGRTHSRTNVVPSLIPARLRDDREFKREVLAELEERGEIVDLRPLVKEYISGISIVHGKVRGILKERLTDADERLLAARTRYRHEGGSRTGVMAVRTNVDGAHVEEVPILTELSVRRHELTGRHVIHKNLWAHYVTNEPESSETDGA